MDEWTEDEPIKKPINEYKVGVDDGRKARAGWTQQRVIEFGWDEGNDPRIDY